MEENGGSHDDELQLLKTSVATLTEMVVRQGQWIERLMRGSIVVVDKNGCGIFRSIQDAIERCNAGDTIIVRRGVYNEHLVVDKSDLTIRAAEDGETTIASHDGITLQIKASSIVRGFKLEQLARYQACVRFEGNGGVLEACDVTCSNLSCVVVGPGTTPTIRHCNIHGSKQHGIAVKAEACPTIEHNTICDHGQPNILIEQGADPIIRGNEIHGSKQNGIWIKAKGRGRITSNEISRNCYSNIDVMTEADPVIEYNKIHGSLKCGICVAEGGRGTIRDNDIYSNDYSNVGIMAGASPCVENNLIRHSKQHGIFCKSESAGVVRDNNVYANALANIKIEPGSTVEHGNNQNPKLRPKPPVGPDSRSISLASVSLSPSAPPSLCSTPTP